MKRNINLMQSNSDIDSSFIDQIGKEYLLQALANLGQRIGIKGDGLKQGSFKFIELLNNENIEYSINDYIGYIEYSNNKAIFGVNHINNNVDIILNKLIDNNINNTLISNREFSFTIPVNNIEKYSKNTIISNNDNILTIITVGKKIGYDDTDSNNAVLLYYKFNTITNKLIYAAKSGHIYSDTGNDYYYLLKINQKIDDNNVALTNKYELTFKIFNVKYENDYYKQSFINTYCFDNHNTDDLYKRLTLPFLTSDFISIENLESYNYNANTNYDSNSTISIILNNIQNSNYYTTHTLDVNLDTATNQLFSVSDDDYKRIINLYKNEYKFNNLAEEINFFNNDITEFYENIFKYYNEKFYLDNRIVFIKRILCKLYEHIFEDLYKEDNTIKLSDLRLYIPLNYNIYYICNSNNELNIYYSNDLYVLFTNTNNLYDRSTLLGSNNYLIINYNNINKVKSYKFEIEYNNLYNDIINSIDVKNIYTMPYVDIDENWNINNYNTSIRAVGKDAGNPNIIIIYSINKEEYKILSAVSNKIDINSVDFKLVKFNINKKLFTNLLSNDDTSCYSWIPNLTKNNYEIFENSIIINISSLNCLNNLDNKKYYLGSNVITIWNYTIENGYSFNLIKDDENCALPLGVTHNLESILSDTSLLNLNEQDLIIFKAKLIGNLGQELLNNISCNWGILKNKNSSEYNPDKTKVNIYDEQFAYNNDLNMCVEYTDNLKLNKSSVEYSNLNKYIPDINDIKNTGITNILYPIYDSQVVTSTNTVNNIIYNIKQVLETAESTKLTINGDTYIVENDLYNIISNKLEKTYKEETYEYSSKIVQPLTKLGQQQYYNEYLFNSNIPNIDFKEIFLRNVNTLNRYNIITLDKDGNTYYSYLGSDYTDEDKSVLHLGSLNKNINVGTDTLMNNNDIDEFKIQNTISIDFNNILLNGAKTVASSRNVSINKIIGNKNFNKNYFSADYNIMDIVSSYVITKTPQFNLSAPIIDITDTANLINASIFNDLNIKTNIRIVKDNADSYYLYLNGIIQDIFDTDIENTDNINFKNIKINFGTNQLITLIDSDNITTGKHLTTPKFLLKVNDPLVITDIIKDDYDNGLYTVLLCADTLTIIMCKYLDTINILCKYNKYNMTGDDNSDIEWAYYKYLTPNSHPISNVIIEPDPTPVTPDPTPEKLNPLIKWVSTNVTYQRSSRNIPSIHNPQGLSNITLTVTGDDINNPSIRIDENNIITVTFVGNDNTIDNNLEINKTITINMHRAEDDTYKEYSSNCTFNININKVGTERTREYYFYYIGTETTMFKNQDTVNINFEETDGNGTPLYHIITDIDDTSQGWKTIVPGTEEIPYAVTTLSEDMSLVKYIIIIPSIYSIFSYGNDQSFAPTRTITINDSTYKSLGEPISYDVIIPSDYLSESQATIKLKH